MYPFTAIAPLLWLKAPNNLSLSGEKAVEKKFPNRKSTISFYHETPYFSRFSTPNIDIYNNVHLFLIIVDISHKSRL